MVHLIFDNWSFRCAFIPLVTVAKSKITRAKILLYFFNCKKIKVVDFHISPTMINKWYETIRRRQLRSLEMFFLFSANLTYNFFKDDIASNN